MKILLHFIKGYIYDTFRIIVTFLVVSEGFSDFINQWKGGGGYILRYIKGDKKGVTGPRNNTIRHYFHSTEMHELYRID